MPQITYARALSNEAGRYIPTIHTMVSRPRSGAHAGVKVSKVARFPHPLPNEINSGDWINQ